MAELRRRADPTTQRDIVLAAVDMGITHLDLANNYGPPPGTPSEVLGEMLAGELAGHRDELVISTKAGYLMWDGPYGSGGTPEAPASRALDQSLGPHGPGLRRHLLLAPLRPGHPAGGDDGRAGRRSCGPGKALYVGVSVLRREDQPRPPRSCGPRRHRCSIHQPSYSMFNRWIEDGLLDHARAEGAGCIAFSPLAQGLLTDRYLDGVPGDSSRATHGAGPFKAEVADRRTT